MQLLGGSFGLRTPLIIMSIYSLLRGLRGCISAATIRVLSAVEPPSALDEAHFLCVEYKV